jgi:fluoride exporter
VSGSGNHPLPVSDDHPRCPSRTARAARTLYHTSLVAAGAVCGGLLRWGVGEAFHSWLDVGFPFGTLFINVTGCLFLGWFGKWLADKLPRRTEELRLLVAVGFCGAYTTFSSYELEASHLLQDGHGVLAAVYLAGSVVLGLLAVQLGVWLATRPGDVRDDLPNPEDCEE